MLGLLFVDLAARATTGRFGKTHSFCPSPHSYENGLHGYGRFLEVSIDFHLLYFPKCLIYE